MRGDTSIMRRNIEERGRNMIIQQLGKCRGTGNRLKKACILMMGMMLLIHGCKKQEKNQILNSQTESQPYYQPLLNAITPSAYRSTDGLDIPEDTYISVIGKEDGGEYWNMVKKGVEQARIDLNKNLEANGKGKIKIEYNAPDISENVDEQVNILDEEMARNPSAIAIASIDEQSSAVQFDLAIQNQIPLVAIDSGNVHNDIQSICKTNNLEAARTGAYKLANEIGNKGKVILVIHDRISQTAKEREAAFAEELHKNYPDVEIAVTICEKEMDAEKEKIASASGKQPSDMSDEDVLLYYMEHTKGIKGVFGTNEKALQYIVDSLDEFEKKAGKRESAGSSTESDEGNSTENSDSLYSAESGENSEHEEVFEYPVVMGFDGGSRMIEYLKSGKIRGIVVQNPFGMGYAGVVAACRAMLQIGNEAIVDTGYTWVTPENMDSPEVAAMLY